MISICCDLQNYTVIELLTLFDLNYSNDENFSPFYCPDINLGGIKKGWDKTFRSRVDSRSSRLIDKFRALSTVPAFVTGPTLSMNIYERNLQSGTSIRP